MGLPKNVNFLTTPTLNTKAQKEAFTLIPPRMRMMIWKTGMKKNSQMSSEKSMEPRKNWKQPLFANSSLTHWKTINMVGFGTVQRKQRVGNNANTDMPYHLALCSKRIRKKSDLMNESDKVSIEELIEQKRIELNAQSKALTPVNLQTFVAWKKRKLREEAEAEAKNNEDKKKKMKSGVHVGMSGRDMFLFDENMGSNENDEGEDKGEAFDLSKLDKEDSDEAPVKVHEIKFDEYGFMDDGLEATTNEQLKNLKGAEGGATAVIDEAAFDEDLFEDEDLDDLEDELNNLEV